MTKVTKRALLSSALALLVCVSMLIGTTYAWFTDSVVSNNNIITSGNLDVELYYATGLDANGELDWNAVESTTEIFDDATLWEPGYTEVVYLKVVNEGSLALKYNLGVNIISETEGKNAAGEAFKLSNYIKFDAIETNVAFADRDAARAAVTDAKIISKGYSKAASLKADEENYIALVVYMPETVGNVANYKTGTNAPVINLGINLFATQYTYEEDSFDEFYDGGAIWQGGVDYSWYINADPSATEYTIGSAEQLAGFAALVNGTAESPLTTFAANSNVPAESFAGKTIKLISDINLNGLAWTPIGTWDNTFEGNFDGQGHTISNLYINDAAGEGVGLFGVVAGSNIKGITLKNVNVAGYSMVSALVGASYPAVISDCHVTGNISIYSEWAYVGGIAGYCYYGTQVDGCSVIADAMGSITSATRNAVGGITAWLLEGNHKVTNCTVKNLNLTGWANIGSITGFVHYNNTIEGCTAENLVLTKTRVDGVPSIGTVAGGYSYSASNATTLKNNNLKDITLNGTAIEYSTYNTLYGSEYGGSTEANFVLEGNTESGIVNNLVIFKLIKTVDELKNALANGGDYVLGADIEIKEGLKVSKDTTVLLNLNDKTISGTDESTAGFAIITNQGNLTITGNGKMTLKSINNRGWNAYSSVISNTVGGKLTIENGTIEHLGGTDMAYAIDNLTNGKGTYAETVINGGTIKSTYRAIRMFLNGTEAENILTVNGGVIEGANKSIWMQDPSKNANTGSLKVSENAVLNGNVYVSVTAGSTEFPATVEIADKALSEGSKVLESNTASVNKVVANIDGVWTLVEGKAITTLDDLQKALDEAKDGDTIVLGANITGDVTVTQKPDVKITIDGNGNTFAGVIIVDGKSATYTTAGLTIKNLVFKADSISADACITLGVSGNNNTRYTCNVTVDGCTFDVPGAVGVKSYTGGDKNLVIKNSTVTAKGHSLVQVAGVDKVLIDNCKVYSKNGANFNSSTDVTVIGSTFDVQGYAVRYGAGSAADTNAETYAIKDCTLKSACAESGDAVIVLRGTAANATLTIENTTITGTPDIINNAQNATVVK